MNKIYICFVFAVFMSSCTTLNDRVLDSSQSQVQVRSYQTKSFDTTDKHNVLRNVVATMQDLGFIIDKADEDIGTVSGYSFTNKTNMTVSVREVNKQTVVRVNAEYNSKPVTEPLAYQNFFNALSQSLFLTANDVL
ncbi:MAG: hypothetical protein PHN29_04975 [Endomicrobiaceae bacterium]|jgi:hypothetical protein|nr:hypothetical protein [Endomicrobiaceae bacterium]